MSQSLLEVGPQKGIRMILERHVGLSTRSSRPISHGQSTIYRATQHHLRQNSVKHPREEKKHENHKESNLITNKKKERKNEDLWHCFWVSLLARVIETRVSAVELQHPLQNSSKGSPNHHYC